MRHKSGIIYPKKQIKEEKAKQAIRDPETPYTFKNNVFHVVGFVEFVKQGDLFKQILKKIFSFLGPIWIYLSE